MGVDTVVYRYLICSEVDALHEKTPHRRVIHAALPGVADIHEALVLWVAFTVEVPMPRFQLGKGIFEELFRARFVLGMLVDRQRRCGVNGWLDHARGFAVSGRVGTFPGVPEVGSRKVVYEAGIEDYLG